MDTTYTPHEGSAVSIVVAHLEANRDVRSLTRSEVAELTNVLPGNVSTVLRPAVKAGMLVATKDGRGFVYSLPEPEEEVPFMAALDSQGELYVRGVHVDDAGGVLFTKEKADALIAYLASWKPAPAADARQ